MRPYIRYVFLIFFLLQSVSIAWLAVSYFRLKNNLSQLSCICLSFDSYKYADCPPKGTTNCILVAEVDNEKIELFSKGVVNQELIMIEVLPFNYGESITESSKLIIKLQVGDELSKTIVDNFFKSHIICGNKSISHNRVLLIYSQYSPGKYAKIYLEYSNN